MASRVAVISGIPGAGKTSLAGELASRHERGVHLEADAFLRFLAHPVDPFSLESRAQAEAMARAVACSARSLAESGYEVFVDGVIGPWNLELYEAELGAFDYAILALDPATAIERMRARGDAEPEADGVQRLWQFFSRYPSILAQHAVSAADPPGAVRDELLRRRAAGDLLRPPAA